MERQEHGPKTKEEIKAELKQIINDYIYGTDDIEEKIKRYEEIRKFADEFRLKNPDWEDMELFHLLSFSTRLYSGKWDTEDHQIENYIKSLNN